jgi:predicted esterase
VCLEGGTDRSYAHAVCEIDRGWGVLLTHGPLPSQLRRLSRLIRCWVAAGLAAASCNPASTLPTCRDHPPIHSSAVRAPWGASPDANSAASAPALPRADSTPTPIGSASARSPSAPTESASAATAASAVGGPPVARSEPETLSNWPCTSCYFRLPPTADAAQPTPLLVVLHGDLGDVERMVHMWKRAADEQGVALLALRCPRDRGCSNSWWRWYLSSQHDEAWLSEQIQAVQARTPIDRARIYAAGYSGGASYLGFYVPTHPRQFAAASHIAGGANFVRSCPLCKTPVHFLIGGQDPMLGMYTDPLRRWYEACQGHELVWEMLPGVTHDAIVPIVQASRGKQLLRWLLLHSNRCLGPATA